MMLSSLSTRSSSHQNQNHASTATHRASTPSFGANMTAISAAKGWSRLVKNKRNSHHLDNTNVGSSHHTDALKDESGRTATSRGSGSRTSTIPVDHDNDHENTPQQPFFLDDPQSHLECLLTRETAPFLSRYISLQVAPPTTVVLLDRSELKVGKLLQEADFCQTMEITGFNKYKQPPQQQQSAPTPTVSHQRRATTPSPLSSFGNTIDNTDMDVSNMSHATSTSSSNNGGNTTNTQSMAAPPRATSLLVKKIRARVLASTAFVGGALPTSMNFAMDDESGLTHTSNYSNIKHYYNYNFNNNSNKPPPKLDPTQKYMVKMLHPRILAQLQQNNNMNGDESELERAAAKLMLEALYLAHLDHPFIIKLRAYTIKGMTALQLTTTGAGAGPVSGQQYLHQRRRYEQLARQYDSLFLVTDRWGDTLDKRLDKWKQWAAYREEQERKRQRPKKYPAPLVPTSSSPSLPSDPNAWQHDIVFKKQLYPEDLVALKTNYAWQILHALQHLHSHGIVLRELRPESIAFCEYPHHHTVQLCDLSSCKEVPTTTNLIAPEVLELELLTHTTAEPTTSRGRASANNNGDCLEAASFHSPSRFQQFPRLVSSGGRATGVVGNTTTIRRDAVPVIAFASARRRPSSLSPKRSPPSSSVTTATPTSKPKQKEQTGPSKSQNNDNAGDTSESSAASGRSSSSSSSSSSPTLESLLGARKTVAARRYMAPEIFGNKGYNTQADVYSWAIVFCEILTEAKPYSSRQLTQDWGRISQGSVRPNIQKCHFPRTIKAVLELAWHANPQQRATASQLCKSMTTILTMLEGQGLPWEQQRQQDASSTASPALDGVLSLPEAAAGYKDLQVHQPQGWSTVWDPKSKQEHQAEEDVQRELDGNKEQLYQRRYKQKTINMPTVKR